MSKIYSRPRKLNKRLCLYLMIAVSTVAFVGYHWSHGGGPRPLSLFSVNEYSSDLPESSDDRDSDLRDEATGSASRDGLLEDNPGTASENVVGSTMKAASKGASQSLEFLAKKLSDTQSRMMSLFGATKTNLPEAGVPENIEDRLPSEGVDNELQSQSRDIDRIEGLGPSKSRDNDMGSDVADLASKGVDIEGDEGLGPSKPSRSQIFGEGADLTGNVEEHRMEAPEPESERFEDGPQNIGVKQEKVEEGVLGRKDGKEQDQGEAEEEEEEEEDDLDKAVEKERAKSTKNPEEEKGADKQVKKKENIVKEVQLEKKVKEVKEEKLVDKEKENKEKKQEKGKEDDKEEKESDKGKEEKSMKKKKTSKKEHKSNEGSDKEDIGEYDDEDENEEEFDEEENKQDTEDYSSKQEEEDQGDRKGLIGKIVSRLGFNGVDSQDYKDAEGREEGTIDTDAPSASQQQGQPSQQGQQPGQIQDFPSTSQGQLPGQVQPELRRFFDQQTQQGQQFPSQQGQRPTDQQSDQAPGSPGQGVLQMQMPPANVIQNSLGLSNDTDSAKTQQMYEAFRNATADPEDVQDMTKQLVDEGKERLKTHVSALQLLKMKQELVRDGLSPELADRFLSSPDPLAVARTFPPSAQAILRKEWDSLREQLSVLQTGSTLEHITASSDLLRPTELRGAMSDTAPTGDTSSQLGQTETPFSQLGQPDGQRGTTLPTGQGYDNPRPLSQDQFDKLITPPTTATAETTVTPPTSADGQQFYKVQVGGTLRPGSFVSFKKSPSGAAQIDIDPRRLPAHLREGGSQPPSMPMGGPVHSLPLGDAPADSALPPEPLNLIPIDSGTGNELPSPEQAGQPQYAGPTCPLELKPSVSSHPVTALVAFSGRHGLDQAGVGTIVRRRI